MKRKIVIVIIFIVTIFFVINAYKSQSESAVIRARVVPNSNSEVDLNIKQEVIVLVKDFLKENYSTSYDEYVDNINKNLASFEERLDLEYQNVTITFNEHTLYNKTYNDNVIKNSSSLLFLVVIGSGEGDNWWGTVFPKYLGIESEETYEYKSFFQEKFDWLR